MPTLSSAVRIRFRLVSQTAVLVVCVSALVSATEPSQPTKPAPGPCTNQEANQLLQRGHETYPKTGYGLPPTVATAGEALTYFKLATEKDPSCAEAYVALAQAYAGFPSWPGMPPKERYNKVEDAAKKAIALQENLAAAHLVLAQAEFNTAQWAPAEKELQRALAVAPKDPSAHVAYAQYLAATGHLDQAVAEIEQARKLVPDPSKLNLAAGSICYWARRYDQAIEYIQPSAGENPIGDFLLGWAYVAKVMWPQAAAVFKKDLAPSDRDAGAVMSLAYVYAATGSRDEVTPLLREVEQKTALMYVPVYRIAAVYVALGDKDKALEWLTRAYNDDIGWMVWLKVDPVMEPLHSDPRFQELLRRMNFPQ